MFDSLALACELCRHRLFRDRFAKAGCIFVNIPGRKSKVTMAVHFHDIETDVIAICQILERVSCTVNMIVVDGSTGDRYLACAWQFCTFERLAAEPRDRIYFPPIPAWPHKPDMFGMHS